MTDRYRVKIRWTYRLRHPIKAWKGKRLLEAIANSKERQEEVKRWALDFVLYRQRHW